MMENNKESGSFVTGFMFGIAAGALGYFAFGTKRGNSVRKRLQEEWLSARDHLATNVGEQNSATETAKSLFGQFKHMLEHSFSSFDSLAVSAEQADKKAGKKKAIKSKKFKGV